MIQTTIERTFKNVTTIIIMIRKSLYPLKQYMKKNISNFPMKLKYVLYIGLKRLEIYFVNLYQSEGICLFYFRD